jgi:excisionase family DNA binding protein
VAEVLRIARSRAYGLVAEGKIPSIRIGSSVRVSRNELDRWLEEDDCLGAVRSSYWWAPRILRSGLRPGLGRSGAG